MAKYITPTLTIASNKYSTGTNSGPTSSPIAISVTDKLDVTEVIAKVIDISDTHKILFDASQIAGANAAGTDGAFIYIKNLTEGMTATADVYIGYGTSADLADAGTPATRLMTLKPGEFSFFAWDFEADLIIDGSNSTAIDGGVEAIMFMRTGTTSA
tara:strand:+ start:86 stop:556 length:471 start_codon:yes stop_codon:yes gene_type:complete